MEETGQTQRGVHHSVPLFALPSYVLFPHTLVPFHVFERCYLQLIDASLAGDRLLVVSGIPTMDDGGYGPPFRVAGLGRVVSDRRYRDGRIDIFAATSDFSEPDAIPFPVWMLAQQEDGSFEEVGAALGLPQEAGGRA
ncbi:MAG: hypothetical protein QF464_15260, partial [Myxococcota bacterium]|nr:hypothetical protein [Myxococcota bacterium]